jgi:aryl carrier-like protein
MEGYLDDAQATQKVIINHPKKAGKPVLLTGDMGVRLANGEIRYLGRKDSQVKIRGHRINLIEIENKLLESHMVDEASVGCLNEHYSNKLIGIVKVKPPITFADLRQWLSKNLPEYMIPQIHFWERIPKNSNGKTDWKKINEILLHDKGLLESNESPTSLNVIEKEILEIWQEVLNKKSIGLNQNFFDIGGHSILLMNVHRRLSQTFFGKQVKIVDLFRLPTIKLLADYLQPSQEIPKKENLENRANLQRVSFAKAKRKMDLPPT